MSLRSLVLLFVPLAIVACADADGDGLRNRAEIKAGTNPDAADTDGDGLSDSEEDELGTDPLDADMDDDLLTDGQEVQLYATDPMSVDTDGDGYEDYDEISTGHNPLDDDDRIYEGGWPFQRYKDDVAARKASKGMVLGKPFARDSFKDQNGDTVDLFDYAYQGVPIVIDISAQWCGPCQSISLWLSGQDEALNQQYDDEYPGVRDAVDNRELFWVTIMGEAQDYSDATKKVCKEWEAEYPHENIAVLADTDRVLVDFVDLGFWPSLILLNEDMSVIETQEDRAALYGAVEYLGGE